LANGTTKKIADIDIGDEVLATDPGTGETSSRTVTDTHVMLHDGDLLDVSIEVDDDQGVTYTTDEHKFWSITGQTWVPAIELDEGDQLRQADGTTATVTGVDERHGRQDMFDLTVDVDHTFYVATGYDAGDPSALVHNCGGIFEKAGIRTTEHFRQRLTQRASRGITEQKALDAYRNGRIFYDPSAKNYIRYSSQTKIAVVTDAPWGRQAITVFEGNPSPRWNPVPWRSN